MRELKFRAWDGLEKRMRKVVSLHWRGDEFASAKLEAVARFKDISDNLGSIMEYEEPEGVKINLRKVINDSMLKPDDEPENNIKPKPPNIPDFNWDVKLGA